MHIHGCERSDEWPSRNSASVLKFSSSRTYVTHAGARGRACRCCCHGFFGATSATILAARHDDNGVAEFSACHFCDIESSGRDAYFSNRVFPLRFIAIMAVLRYLPSAVISLRARFCSRLTYIAARAFRGGRRKLRDFIGV